jgi:hypothetical protein
MLEDGFYARIGCVSTTLKFAPTSILIVVNYVVLFSSAS